MAAYTRSIKEGTVREVLEAFWVHTLSWKKIGKKLKKATDLKNQGVPGSGVIVSMFFCAAGTCAIRMGMN